MTGHIHSTKIISVLAVLLGILAIISRAHAVPSYANQTGQACSSCHVGNFGPQLTPYGRAFKLGGYSDSKDDKFHIPISFLFSTAFTHTTKDQSTPPTDHSKVNDNLAPQEGSILIAGKIAEHFGSFVQVTYSHTDRKVSLDQADIRYARPAKVGNTDFIWGIDFNNNPTLQDPFNSFGAFAYPYITSTLAPGLSATPLIVGGLSHQVAGISTYIFINSNIYAELGGYTSLGHGFLHDFGIDDSAGKLAGVAPYWRLAYVKDWEGQSASLGLVGMRARLHPGRQAGPTDKYDDFGFDGTYQYIGDGKNVFSLNTAYIFETQNLDFAIFNGDTDRRRHELNQFTADASWYYKGSYGLTLGLFSTTGSLDTNLLTSAPDSGSRVGRPDTDGYRLEANWVPFGNESSWGAPWANLRLGVQFTGYLKFNGAKYDYDGFGRKASDNNTTYVYTWFAF